MRCPRCRARNPDRAEWCSQCYAPLTGDEPSAAVPAAPPVAPTDPAVDARTADRSGAPGPPAASSGPSFRRGDEGLEWRCDACGEWNPFECPTCSVCGRAFDPTEGPETVSAPARPEAAVVGASVAVPGAGHALLGRPISGVARFVTWLLWLAGGLWLLRGAATSGGSPLPAVPLLLGAGVIWITAPVDALLLHRGDPRELLTPRVFLWLVVGVIGFLLLSFLSAALTLPGAAS